MSHQAQTCLDCAHRGTRECSGCFQLGIRTKWLRADAPAARQEPAQAPIAVRRHQHYFRDVSALQSVDVYRVLHLFAVTDPCIQHAIKKLLVAGGRGVKDQAKDVQEAIDTLERWHEMREEEGGQA